MLERMLVGRIENRITVGLVSFVLTMVFLGWAAINEGGRMAAFEEMQTARHIEQGALLYASNCSTCHGADGKGLAGRAPALNGPQFFNHDFFPEITREVGTLEVERTGLTQERARAETSDARRVEIDTRLAEIEARITALNTERRTAVDPAIARGYDPTRWSRLTNLGWVGTQEAFISTTLVHGRPVSGNYWPQAMAAWSQQAGGPLRTDQISNLTDYIMNWDKGAGWTLDDLFAVNQFAIEPADPAPLLEQIRLLQVSGGVLPEPVGYNVPDIVTQLAAFENADPARGDALYHGTEQATLGGVLGCQGCHLADANGTGPMTSGTWTRASGERLAALPGYTPEQYIVESILMPGNYTVAGFNNVMPANFGDRLTLKDLADLLAYIKTQNQ